MDKLTTIARKADVLFGLRPALEKFGFSPQEDIFIVFAYKDKEVRTGAIPPFLEGRTSSLSLDNVNLAVIDWLNKAEILYEYGSVYTKELGIKGEGDFDITLKIVSKSNELTLTNCQYCCPCGPGAPFCCLK